MAFSTSIRFGAGRIAEFAAARRELGSARPLVVTDRGLQANPMIAARRGAGGMDAPSRALEAYCRATYHPMADGIALEAMRLVAVWLPRAVADGADLEARAHMPVAASMGAVAFQKGLGAMHAMSHPCSARFDTHHGLTNAVPMPYVLVYNRPAIEARVSCAARVLGLGKQNFDGFLDWVLALREDIAIPHDLAAIGVMDAHESIGRARALDRDHLIAADAGAPVGDGARRLRGQRRRARAPVDNHEVVAQPVHLCEPQCHARRYRTAAALPSKPGRAYPASVPPASGRCA